MSCLFEAGQVCMDKLPACGTPCGQTVLSLQLVHTALPLVSRFNWKAHL